MLEQIDAAAEDARKTRLIVALGMLSFALWTLAAAGVGGWTALTTVGLLVGSAGAALLQATMQRRTLQPKRFRS